MVITNQMPQTPGLWVNSKGSPKAFEVWLVSLLHCNEKYLDHGYISEIVNLIFIKLRLKYEKLEVHQNIHVFKSISWN